jgi:hypothetical protein
MTKCAARITTNGIDDNGVYFEETHRCTQEAEAGYDLCYKCRKYEQGLMQPANSTNNRSQAQQTVKVVGPRGVIWEEK